jgi:NAD(P)-dependent dehydrogenase (short-subunit alcohol dehydrogenase family)
MEASTSQAARDCAALRGKRALITGASSGIGRATALRFAREGALVGLVSNRQALLEEVAQIIWKDEGKALVLPADVSKEPEVEGAVARVVAEWGGLDCLVAVAGIELFGQGDDRVDRLSLDAWQKIMDTNLTGMFLSCKHAVGAMLKSGGGSVIVTGSPTGMYGCCLGEHAYSASKAGCHGLARVMANEYAPYGIRVNIVVPGFIDTPINAPVMANPKLYEELRQRIPMRRAGLPEEVAAMNVWLASDEASFATGAYFVVDGGETAI